MSILSYEQVVSAPSVRTPRIGYRNLFREGTVVASGEATGFPKELAYDGLTYDGWRGAGGSPTEEWLRVSVAGSPTTTADYGAIAAHTLTGATLTWQRSDNAVTWTNLESSFVPQSNRPIVWEWTEVAAAYWRLLIQNATSTVQIGAIHVGRKYTLPRGFGPGWSAPSLNEDISYSNSISEGGQIIGRSVVRRGVSVDAQTREMEYTVARADWLPFLSSAERYPFFFWRVIEGYAEIVYGGLKSHSAQLATRGKFVSTSFSLEGISR